jgi:ubiquinone/menaquinone biosynthesis C-methylase UbiE
VLRTEKPVAGENILAIRAGWFCFLFMGAIVKKDNYIGKTRKYRNSTANIPPKLVGVFPMGRCGIVEVFYRHYFELKHFKKQVHLNRDMNVLELGCGTGRWASSLAPLVKHYTGVDFSQSSLDIAQEDLDTHRIENVLLLKQSILDFKGERPYDVVYFSGVTQYIQEEDIGIILANIAPCLTEKTIIVDRSTVNYRKREEHSVKDYFAIFRTPTDLEEIFVPYGFRLIYSKRSYRFLRGSSFLMAKGYKNFLLASVQLTRPFSYYLLLAMSLIADVVHPVQFEGGDRSHDFFIFKR